MPSINGKGFIHLLKPSPELWTLALPHRTQILYQPDTSFILLNLDIKPSSNVIESGTGSGSFSHSVARCLGNNGHLHSFEYHSTRVKKVIDEFQSHHLLDRISVYHRDVCKFGFEPSLVNTIDAIFLDLPMPWEAIPSAKDMLNKSKLSKICCFSPCIEQVLKTVSSLNSNGFSNITMFEVLTRNFETSTHTIPTVTDATSKLKDVIKRKEVRRQNQMKKASLNNSKSNQDMKQQSESELNEVNKDGQILDENQGEDQQSMDVNEEDGQQIPPSNKRKFDEVEENKLSLEVPHVLSRPFMDARGHTSYLTCLSFFSLTFFSSKTNFFFFSCIFITL